MQSFWIHLGIGLGLWLFYFIPTSQVPKGSFFVLHWVFLVVSVWTGGSHPLFSPLCERLGISLAVFPLRLCWWSKVTLELLGMGVWGGWEWAAPGYKNTARNANWQQTEAENQLLFFFFLISCLFPEENKEGRRESWVGAAWEGAQSVPPA